MSQKATNERENMKENKREEGSLKKELLEEVGVYYESPESSRAIGLYANLAEIITGSEVSWHSDMDDEIYFHSKESEKIKDFINSTKYIINEIEAFMKRELSLEFDPHIVIKHALSDDESGYLSGESITEVFDMGGNKKEVDYEYINDLEAGYQRSRHMGKLVTRSSNDKL